jgi:hypothetical protein
VILIRSRVQKLTDITPDIESLLKGLRRKCGDSEFGYRMQALFAHTIIRKGWHITAINAKGHPDIRAQTSDDELLIQVKSNAHLSANSNLELSLDDVGGIKAVGRRTGWFAVLDCAAPVQWIMISGVRAVSLLGRPMHLATLKANCDLEMSTSCSRHFYGVISDNHVRLATLTFQVLCRRALAGDGV